MATEAELFDALKYRVMATENGTRIYHNSAGQVHREEGPAVEWTDGTKMWRYNDMLHRTDGPAVEYTNGTKFWFLYDAQYTESEYYTALKAMGIQK